MFIIFIIAGTLQSGRSLIRANLNVAVAHGHPSQSPAQGSGSDFRYRTYRPTELRERVVVARRHAPRLNLSCPGAAREERMNSVPERKQETEI